MLFCDKYEVGKKQKQKTENKIPTTLLKTVVFFGSRVPFNLSKS